MKKIRVLCQALTLLLMGSIAGCSGGGGMPMAGQTAESFNQLNVVTTLFPYYDFVRQIAGDDVEITLVIPAGMDSHSFEPTPADMRTIQNADILISNGGTMEHWLDEVLDAVDTSDMTVVTMMDYVDTVEEEIVEGMEDDEDHDHEEHEHDHGDHDHGSETSHAAKDYVDYDGHEAEIEYDEHIWTSPVNAMKMAEVICDTLEEADPEHASDYHANTEAYLGELQKLDEAFREISAQRRRNLIVVGDKFPFRYLADEYELDYRAAFSGCSTDTEPSAKTIAYLIDKIRADQIPVVYYLELSTHRVSDIIGEETGAQPLLLHSCHNVTRQQLDAGVTYVELMQGNIENLRKGIEE